jgi:hypothetical protein
MTFPEKRSPDQPLSPTLTLDTPAQLAHLRLLRQEHAKAMRAVDDIAERLRDAEIDPTTDEGWDKARKYEIAVMRRRLAAEGLG